MVAYCDYIANKIEKSLCDSSTSEYIKDVDCVQWDLDKNGAFQSTKKRIEVMDVNGKKYLVTVEEKPLETTEKFMTLQQNLNSGFSDVQKHHSNVKLTFDKDSHALLGVEMIKKEFGERLA
jgi:hypothetical protein